MLLVIFSISWAIPLSFSLDMSQHAFKPLFARISIYYHMTIWFWHCPDRWNRNSGLGRVVCEMHEFSDLIASEAALHQAHHTDLDQYVQLLD